MLFNQLKTEQGGTSDALEIHLLNKEVNVTLPAIIDVDTATSMREKLLPLTEKGFKHFVFCFEKVDHIDSSGIGILVVIHKKVAQMDGSVILQGLRGDIKEIFHATRLTRTFEMQ